jgi:hypothetical protein
MRSVQPFVMRARDRADVLQDVAAGEDSLGVVDVQPHALPLVE